MGRKNRPSDVEGQAELALQDTNPGASLAEIERKAAEIAARAEAELAERAAELEVQRRDSEIAQLAREAAERAASEDEARRREATRVTEEARMESERAEAERREVERAAARREAEAQQREAERVETARLSAEVDEAMAARRERLEAERVYEVPPLADAPSQRPASTRPMSRSAIPSSRPAPAAPRPPSRPGSEEPASSVRPIVRDYAPGIPSMDELESRAPRPRDDTVRSRPPLTSDTPSPEPLRSRSSSRIRQSRTPPPSEPARAANTPPPEPRQHLPQRPFPPAISIEPGVEVTGELLRSLREERGISLKDIEEVTRVRAASLSAIEAERFEELPQVRVYVKGFVQAYARWIGVDPELAAMSYLLRWERWRDRPPASKRRVSK